MKIICIPILIMFFLLGTAGCHVTKNTDKKEQVKESLSETQMKRDIRERDSIISVLKQRIYELEYVGVILTPCPQVNLDSLTDALIMANCKPEEVDKLVKLYQDSRAKIVMLENGMTEITGNIASYQRSKSRLEETVATQKTTIDRLTTELAQSKAAVKEKIVEKVKTVEKEVFPWYSLWLILAALIGGCILGWWLKGKTDALANLGADVGPL